MYNRTQQLFSCKHNIKKINYDTDRFLCAKQVTDSKNIFFPLWSELETATLNKLVKSWPQIIAKYTIYHFLQV